MTDTTSERTEAWLRVYLAARDRGLDVRAAMAEADVVDNHFASWLTGVSAAGRANTNTETLGTLHTD